jgi:hypothetical protein
VTRKGANLPGGVPFQLAKLRADHARGGVLAAGGGARGEVDRADGDGSSRVLTALQGIPREARRGLLRNVAVALGNWGSPEAVPVLARALDDEEPLIRGHAAWAPGRIGTAEALESLRARVDVEEQPWVREEVEIALEG